MSLKVFINGVSKNLTPVGKPPVTFVNGVKKVLTKGVTFINGEKVVLWDTNRLKINYIDLGSVNGAYTQGVVFFASGSKVLYSTGQNVTRLDVSNLGNVTVDSVVQSGEVMGFSSVDSTASNRVYYSRSSASGTTIFNQLNVDPATGGVVASNSMSLGSSIDVGALGYIGNWLSANNVGNSSRSVSVRLNGSQVYWYQSLPTTGSLSGGWLGCPNFTKIDANTLVGRLQIYNDFTGIGEFTSSTKIAKTGQVGYYDFLVDGDIVACAGSGFGLYQRNTSGNYTELATVAGLAGHQERLVGKCRGYYYTIAASRGSGGDGKNYLRVFDSNGSLVDTVELEAGLSFFSSDYPPFVPYISTTGYLAFIPRYGNRKLVLIQCY